nr:hypothetical protein [Nannocystis pusilla]
MRTATRAGGDLRQPLDIGDLAERLAHRDEHVPLALRREVGHAAPRQVTVGRVQPERDHPHLSLYHLGLLEARRPDGDVGLAP